MTFIIFQIVLPKQNSYIYNTEGKYTPSWVSLGECCWCNCCYWCVCYLVRVSLNECIMYHLKNNEQKSHLNARTVKVFIFCSFAWQTVKLITVLERMLMIEQGTSSYHVSHPWSFRIGKTLRMTEWTIVNA